MGFSDNKTAKYPGALGDLKPVMDKLASSVFETSAKTINTGDETYTVPTSTPYAIRLRYVPKETRDGSGNPIGVAIAGMTEIAWSDTAAPSTAQFMVNYLNGEVKFSAASAGASVQPAYQGVESRAWAESLNEVLRELRKIQEILGINVQGAYQTAKDRIIATEGEVQTARAGKATLDDRLDQIEAALAPMAGASSTRQEPSAETGVLGTAQIELDFDLYVDTDTVIAANVKLKDSQNVDYPLTLSYNKTNRRITGTHSALVDEVYTVYTLAGLRDTLGRSVTPVAWSYGVGAAVANDTPDVTNLQVLNPSLLGFTAKGTITDLENDTITRVDVRYGTVNNPEDPGNLTVQLTGSDIAAFQSVNGKTLNLSLTAGNWYSWARAAALLPSGGTQVGDWSTSYGFVVAANARPVVSNLQTLAQSQTGFSAKGTIADNESDPITQLDIVWSQNGSANPDTLFAGSTKVSYTQSGEISAFQAAGGKAVTATLASGDWFWWSRAYDAGGAGSWVRIGSAFNVPANSSPSVSNVAVSNANTIGFNIAGDITEPESDAIDRVEIQYTLQTDTGWESATTVTLTTSTDIEAFRTGVGAATYAVSATLSQNANMMARARARDVGSGAFGAYSTAATFSVSSARGYAMGGYVSADSAEIDGIQFDNEAAINPAAALSVARFLVAGTNSATRGYAMGGRVSAAVVNEIDGIQFDNESAVNPAAALSVARESAAGVNSSAKGYAMGGHGVTDNVNEIDGIQFDNEAAINPAAALAVARKYHGGVNSSARGYALGGNTTVIVNEIDGIQFDNDAAINPAAALSVARQFIAGVNSSAKGYALGGDTGAVSAEIDGILFSNESAINPAAALSVARFASAGVNGTTKGYALGGYTTVNVAEIDGIQFDNEAAINPAAALSVARRGMAGVQSGGIL